MLFGANYGNGDGTIINDGSGGTPLLYDPDPEINALFEVLWGMYHDVSDGYFDLDQYNPWERHLGETLLLAAAAEIENEFSKTVGLITDAIGIIENLHNNGKIDSNWINEQFEGGIDNENFNIHFRLNELCISCPEREKRITMATNNSVVQPGAGILIWSPSIGNINNVEDAIRLVAHEYRHLEKENQTNWRRANDSVLYDYTQRQEYRRKAQNDADDWANDVVEAWKNL